jgi:hypothetical protein
MCFLFGEEVSIAASVFLRNGGRSVEVVQLQKGCASGGKRVIVSNAVEK